MKTNIVLYDPASAIKQPLLLIPSVSEAASELSRCRPLRRKSLYGRSALQASPALRSAEIRFATSVSRPIRKTNY